MNVRDWLHVGDHCAALWAVLTKGTPGETYNIGGHNEKANLHLVQLICDFIDEMKPGLGGGSRHLITFVPDRPGHDRRYAIDASKLKTELGWEPSIRAEEGFRQTAQWYLNNENWLEHVLTGAYQAYYNEQYR